MIPVLYDAYYNGGPFHGAIANGGSHDPAVPRSSTAKSRAQLPSGQLWDNYSTITDADATMQRMIVFPPGAPQAARSALRAAVARLGDDKAHAEEAMKSIGFVPDWETGADTNERARAVMSIDPRGAQPSSPTTSRLRTNRTRRRLMYFSPARGALLALLGAAWVVAASHAGAQTPFYKGKRLTVLVNYAAGGPTDIEGRLFARHIAKHIEGEPNIIVQNMDGAGGIIGTSCLGEIAPKDGTMMGYLTGAAWVFANEPKKFRVDFRKYEFIAYQPGTTVYYVRSDVAPGMKQPRPTSSRRKD